MNVAPSDSSTATMPPATPARASGPSRGRLVRCRTRRPGPTRGTSQYQDATGPSAAPVSARVRPVPLVGLAARRAHHLFRGGLHAAREVARAEARLRVVLDDAGGADVRQRALETVADLDAHLPIVHEHEEDDPVVLVLLADLPRPEGGGREVLDGGVRGQPAVDVDEDLVRRLALELRETLVEDGQARARPRLRRGRSRTGRAARGRRRRGGASRTQDERERRGPHQLPLAPPPPLLPPPPE